MDDQKIEVSFEAEMLKIYKEAYRACNHNATIFHKMLSDLGGYETANRLLSQHGLQYGFEKICGKGYCYLTMESLVLREPWRSLFNDKQREIAIARLKTFNYGFDHGEIIE